MMGQMVSTLSRRSKKGERRGRKGKRGKKEERGEESEQAGLTFFTRLYSIKSKCQAMALQKAISII